jgi:hypothetical protein
VLDKHGFFGPVQYHHWVVYLVVGLLLVALVAGWYVFMVRHSARRLPPTVGGGVTGAAQLAALQSKYQSLVSEVATEHQAGRLGDRAAVNRLSLLLRFFAHEAKGVDARVMTLADLRRSQLPSVSGAVEQYYPPSFQRDAPGDVSSAVDTARGVIRSWN